MRPSGSPYPKASLGAAVRARRAALSHSARGNVARSGEPGIRLYAGLLRGGRERGGALAPRRGSARRATRVPEPCRAVSQPSATSSA